MTLISRRPSLLHLANFVNLSKVSIYLHNIILDHAMLSQAEALRDLALETPR